jgi:hypothetical protein
VAAVVQALVLAVALAGGVDQRQVRRLAAGLLAGLDTRKVQRFERDRDFFGKADADEAAGRDGVTVADQAHRLLRGDDLAALGGLQGGKPRVRSG